MVSLVFFLFRLFSSLCNLSATGRIKVRTTIDECLVNLSRYNLSFASYILHRKRSIYKISVFKLELKKITTTLLNACHLREKLKYENCKLEKFILVFKNFDS